MKYVLVDKYDNILGRKDFDEHVSLDQVRKYFIKSKKIEETTFDSLWRVMNEQRYKEIEKSSLRRPSSSYGEFGDWLDFEKS